MPKNIDSSVRVVRRGRDTRVDMNLLPALKKLLISNCHMGIDVGVHYSTTTRTYRRVGKGVAVA